jgi:hypothetical protein
MEESNSEAKGETSFKNKLMICDRWQTACSIRRFLRVGFLNSSVFFLQPGEEQRREETHPYKGAGQDGELNSALQENRRKEAGVRGGRNVSRRYKDAKRDDDRGSEVKTPRRRAALWGTRRVLFCGKISLALTSAQTRVSVPPRRKLSRRGEVAEQRTAAQRKAAPSRMKGAAVGRNQQPESTLDSEPYFPFSMYSLRCLAQASARDCWPRVAWVQVAGRRDCSCALRTPR